MTEVGGVCVLLLTMAMGDWDLPLQVHAGLVAQSTVASRYVKFLSQISDSNGTL